MDVTEPAAEGSKASESGRIRFLCMPGSPYTGSTLLGLLLNQHPDCVSIGASTGLTRRVDIETYRCSCGRLFQECEFWNDIADRTRALGHPVNIFETNFWNTHFRLSRDRYLNGLLVRSFGSRPVNDFRDATLGRLPSIRRRIEGTSWNSWSLATAVLERTGKSVFVDTARDHQRPRYLARHPLLDVRVIHLVRDPRGNAASIMKHTGVDVATAARQWRHYNLEAARTRGYVAPGVWMSLHYEDLCSDPAAVLKRIYGFLDIDTADRDGISDLQHHIIGNSMRLRGLDEIREDQSWRTILTHEDLDTIARITGPTSHDLGFAWP